MHSIWIRNASVFLVILTVAGEAVLSGCAPPAAPADGGGKSLQLSTATAKPGEFITLSHGGIDAGEVLIIEFTNSDGLAVRVESLDVRDGQVDVAVPPFVDATNATISSGEVTVSIDGLAGEASLDIEGLYELDGVAPGAILAMFLESALEDYQRTAGNLETIGAELGNAVGAAAVDAIDARIAELRATLDQLETTGELTVNLGDTQSVTLSGDSLGQADRLLVNMIAGLDVANAATLKPPASNRSISECIPTPPAGLTTEQCIGEVLEDVKQFTQEKGTKLAGYLATGVGVVVAVAGAVEGAPLILLTGVIVSVEGGAVAFTDAGLQGKNTDSFLQNDGEGFSASLEILSQVGRVLVSAASTGASALKNAFSTALDAVDKGIAAFDGYSAIKCDEESQQKRFAQQQGGPEIQFCTVARPAGCDNSCPSAFNGVCDDGGAGSFSAVCAAGSDCTDCGVRDTVNDVTPGDEPFTIIGYANTDCVNPDDPATPPGACGVGTSFDPSLAQIQLRGSPSDPDISWPGISNAFVLFVATSGASVLYGIEGESPPDEEGDTEQVPFSFSSINYGTYGRTNTVPLEGPSGPLGSADAVPLSSGSIYSVNIGTLDGTVAALIFQVN